MTIEVELVYCTHLLSLISIVAFIIAINFSDSLLKIAVYLAVISMLSVLSYASLGALDVAITELSINTCIGLAVLLSSSYVVGCGIKERFSLIHFISFFISMSLFCAALFFISAFKEFGSSSPINTGNASHSYIEKTRIRFHFKNIVTAILGSFRAFDTLCETIVIFISAISVFAIIKKSKKINKLKE